VSLPNLVEEAEMWEWAGVSLGEEETYKLQKALKKLAVMSGASALRFWGKVYGSEQDYLVVEGDLLKSEEALQDPTQEPRGTGCNRFVYWVTHNVLADWVQLPDTTPAHLNAARLIKHLFTGNLSAAVDSNPFFPGKERHYLRA
jgi:radial spoke head protein 4A